MFIKRAALIALLSTLTTTLWSADTYLLSNNLSGKKQTSDDFSEWPQSLDTDMKVTWVTEGEFANDDETLKNGQKGILFDGNTGSNWKSIVFTKWNRGHWVTLNLDFGKEYLIKGVDVWAIHEETRDTEFIEILFSQDGVNYIPHQRQAMPDMPLVKGNFVKIPLRLENPVLAQYVQIRTARRKSTRQQQIAEIAVWGSLPDAGTTYLTANDRPEVEFTIEKVQSGVANIDWEDFQKLNPSVKAWTIYSSDKLFTSIKEPGVKLLKKVDGKVGRTTLYPLDAGKTYYFAVSAVFSEGENPKVLSQECTMPLTLTMETFSDMVAINHFWGGGGNRQQDLGRDNEAYETVALDLLAQTGISDLRWWKTDREIVEKYYDKGIGLYTYPYGNNMDKGLALGVHAFSGPGNEPDLKTTPIEHYLNNLKAVYAKKEKLSPESVICAPSSGLEDSSIEWLDRFYDLGGKDYFDVLDLHTYCKIAGGHTQPDGYPRGAPEAMYDNMRKIREVLKKHGDLDKPIISTEFGYSEAPVNNPSGTVTPQIKAEYIVRGLIIHHVLGFKRVFLYSFFDEGKDQNFTEHTFGLIDNDLQKKPAYFAVETLMQTLGDGIYEGPVQGVDQPAFAYTFKHRDSDLKTIVIWDGTQDQVATFKTKAKEVTLTTLLGETLTLIPNKEGLVTAPYGPAPIYLSATSPLEYIGSEDVQNTASNSAWNLRPSVEEAIVGANQKTFALPLEIEGKLDGPEEVRVIVSDENAGVLLDREMTLKSSDSIPALSLDLSQLRSPLQKLKLQIVQQSKGLSISKDYYVFLRRLQPHPDSTQPQVVQFPGVEQPVYVLSNEQLTVTIDAARGGRVLEFIDNATLSNQIRMDLEILPNLPSVPFAFGIWSKFNGSLKNSPLDVVNATGDKLTLRGTVGNLEVTQIWRLSNATLEHGIIIKNKGASPEPVRVEVHPEYNVGGTGESVTDVLFFPLSGRVEKLPFWSGLGEKNCGELSDNWWAVLDTTTGLSLKQQINTKDWAAPRIWFGQGYYNVEFKTRPGMTLEAGNTWDTQMSWTLETNQTEADFVNLKTTL